MTATALVLFMTLPGLSRSTAAWYVQERAQCADAMLYHRLCDVTAVAAGWLFTGLWRRRQPKRLYRWSGQCFAGPDWRRHSVRYDSRKRVALFQMTFAVIRLP